MKQRSLRYVDASRPAGWFRRLFCSLVATRVGRALSRKLLWRSEPVLLRLTGGRIGSGMGLLKTAVLETKGARSGKRHTRALIYFNDESSVVLVASYAGAPRHPDWFHNLVANPEVSFGGRRMRASVVTDPAERERLEALGDNVFPPYARYRSDASAHGREVPIVRLDPL